MRYRGAAPAVHGWWHTAAAGARLGHLDGQVMLSRQGTLRQKNGRQCWLIKCRAAVAGGGGQRGRGQQGGAEAG